MAVAAVYDRRIFQRPTSNESAEFIMLNGVLILSFMEMPILRTARRRNVIFLEGDCMQTLRLTVAIILTANAISGRSVASPDKDHLLPLYIYEYPSYRNIVRSKLSVTPFNCGRSIVLPFYGPEAADSVYWIPSNGRKTYYVTYISAEENLWQRTDGGRYPARAKAVKTRRIDAEIPERTAQLVRKVWLRMLEGTQRPRRTPARKRRVISLHPILLEFSIERLNAAPLYGELIVSDPFRGKKTKQFVEVSEAVYQYCIAQPAQRPAIAKRIEQKAERLLAWLQKKQ